VESISNFYSGKNVVVTGGASFIGSHLVDRLVELDARVRVIDDLSSGTMDNLQNSRDSIEFVNVDLRNQNEALDGLSGAEIVFHLANIHGGRGFIETHPGEIAQNFLIDGNVLFAAKENKIKAFCYASSACVYPTNLQTASAKGDSRFLSEEMADPFKEGGAFADGVYGWAKFMGELALKSYHEQFGLKGVACRLFTVYGPRENESHAVIAFIAKAMLRQDPFEIWGSGSQDRNFTYVDDVVEGMLIATSKISDASAINIGTDEIITIKQAASTICKILDFAPANYFFDTSKPEGVNARAASTVLAKAKLAWEPSVRFDIGIEKTIEWYRNHVDLERLRIDLARKLMERG
jgi:nucleoside-diphosphate-sugar epimerase